MSQVFQFLKFDKTKRNLFLKNRGFIIAITTRCNFNCPHCNRQIYDKNKTLKQDLPFSLFDKILKEAKKKNFVFISFAGGEPILHPEFEDFIKTASESGYFYGITSNGFLYEEYWNIVRKYGKGFSFFNFSVDGADVETHDKVRNFPGSFSRVIEAVKFFKNKNISVKVTTCFTKDNSPQIKKMADLFYALQIDEWRCTAVDLSLNNKQWQMADEEKMALKTILEETKKNHPVGAKIKILSGIQVARPDNISFCGMLNGELLAIDPIGGMLFCCDIYKDCPIRPILQKIDFDTAFALTLASIEELKKQREKDVVNNWKFPGFNSCDYCNYYIEEIFKKIVQN